VPFTLLGTLCATQGTVQNRVQRFAAGPCGTWHDRAPCQHHFYRIFPFPSSFLLLSTLALFTRRHIPLLSTFPSHSPLKSSPIFFKFLPQILYFPHKFSFTTFKLLKFVQFYPTHLSLSLYKTLTSIFDVKGCRESKASICSHFSSC